MSLPESITNNLETSNSGTKIELSIHHNTEDPSESVDVQNGSSAGHGHALRNSIEAGEKSVNHTVDSYSRDEEANQVNGILTDNSGRNVPEELAEKIQGLSMSADEAVPGMSEEARMGKPAWGTVGGGSPRSTPNRALQDDIYLDPTPKTPRQEISPSGEPSGSTEPQADEGSTSEIRSIMDQFEAGKGTGDDMGNPEADDNIPHLKSPVEHPPRRSSLEPLRSLIPDAGSSTSNLNEPLDQTSVLTTSDNEDSTLTSTSKPTPARTSSLLQSAQHYATEANTQPSSDSPRSLSKTLPPTPDPEPDLPFDFHRFLEQLRHRTADPVAKFLRSFLIEFGKKQWMVHEQVKIINDFLTFITSKMAQCEVWKGVSDAEFDNAKEGMEKLVMNRLYSQTFSPAIPAAVHVQGTQNKKNNNKRSQGPGRKGQHQEDIERDEILGQKVRIYGWIQEEHLDIDPVGDSGRRFLVLAQQELLKIKTYRAPRDKVICVLNCCKVIFGLLRNSRGADTSADSFVPLLIYVVLHANPEHLVSNVQYILRFRNQEKLGGEAGYYLSSLMGAIQFIENLDRTSLTISDEEFEKRVEKAVSIIAEGHKEEIPSQSPPRHLNHAPISEKSTLSQPEVIPRNSIDAEYSTSRGPGSSRANNQSSMGNDGSDDNAVSGLLRTIQKPLSSLGRMFSEDTPSLPQRSQERFQHQPYPPSRLSPAVFLPPRNSDEEQRSPEMARPAGYQDQKQEQRLSAEGAAARQASAEAIAAQRIQRAEHQDLVETLAGMFPNLDRDIIDDVVRVKQGRVGLAVDACLALSS